MGYYWNMNGLLVGIPISKQAPFRQILDRLQTELTQHMKNLRFLDHGAGNPRVTSGLRFYEGNVEQRQLGILRFWRDLKILTPHWQRTAQPVKSELVSEPVQLQIYIYINIITRILRILVVIKVAYHTSTIQWEFQDPKMEVLYHIRPYFGGISPYIGLT